MVWRKDDPEGNESQKVKWDIVPYTSGRGLELGSGATKTFNHFIGVDNQHHNKFGWTIRPDIKSDCENLDLFESASMDFIFSSHVLEHIENTEKTLKEWWRLIKPGGYLVLYLPHKDFYPNIGHKDANPYHLHDFQPSDIEGIMESVGNWDLVRNEDRNEDNEYSFFQVYKKVFVSNDSKKKRHFRSYQNPKPEKTCAVVRYGAFGDHIQTASLFPELKKQGYHITMYSSNPGFEAIKHDPHIDTVILQDKDQVKNEELLQFWDHEAKKYDKWINLSESVEGTWLALPGRASHRWPHAVRQKHMNVNYLEFMHDLAGLPYKPGQAFYPTEHEKAWAQKERAKIHGRVVLWSLAGSAVHKTWPYLDEIVARLMLQHRDVHVILTGGSECTMLEAGWESEPRVHRKCGVWSIRETLSFLQTVDMVVGPETGVLNAAAFMDMPKVITLSHSSVENLTRDWVNTISLTPRNTNCYPCHQLHYNFQFCRKDEAIGVAACQSDIPADDMYKAIEQCLVPAQLHSA